MDGSRIDLSEYRDLVSGMPVPTSEQRAAFAVYVSNAHSWYKKIPPLLPGARFLAFVDPSAGMDRKLEGGRWITVWRHEPGFHYAARPSEEHRARLGLLAFATRGATQAGVQERTGMRLETGLGASIVDRDGRIRALPHEVEETGAVRLTSLIHDGFCMPFTYQLLSRMSDEAARWPAEVGGVAAFERIIERCNEVLAHRDRAVRMPPRPGGDATLDAMLDPERQRQRHLLVDAIGRVVDLLEPRDATTF